MPISIDVYSHDDAYRWLAHWLGDTEYTKLHCQNLSLFTRGVRDEDPDADPAKQPYRLFPAVGEHRIDEGGGMDLVVKRENIQTTDGSPLERLTLSTTKGDRSWLLGIIDAARQLANERLNGKLAINTARHGSWNLAQLQAPRPLDSVVLPAGTAQTLLDDMRWFLGSERWYAERGLPYRRGYLFHGAPGCGKTSLTTALASALGLALHFLSLTGLRGDDSLRSLLEDLPARSILLLEDVDAVFADRSSKKQKERTEDTGVSFSGLLNALDGAVASTGRILIMTTNHKEKLDPALIRPGRVDKEVEIGVADADMATRMYYRFFPQASGVEAVVWGNKHKGQPCSALQGRLIEMSMGR